MSNEQYPFGELQEYIPLKKSKDKEAFLVGSATKRNACVPSSISIANPHDAFFKTTMTDVRMARRFFEIYLPEEYKVNCDLSTLKLQSGSFIDSNLRQHLSDILYAIQVNGERGYIYCLIEHVTQAKSTTAFQMLRYQVAAMHQAMVQGEDEPPIVIPLLFYRGQKSPYPFSCSVFDCFKDKQLARKTLLSPHLLVDISVMPDEELETHKEIAMMELLEKHITLRDMIQLIPYLTLSRFRDYLSTDEFKSVVKYLQEAGHSDNYPKFFEEFNRATYLQGDKSIMQTFGDYLRQEGMQKGIHEGMQQGIHRGIDQATHRLAKNMLVEGLAPETIAKVTGLSLEEIKALA